MQICTSENVSTTAFQYIIWGNVLWLAHLPLDKMADIIRCIFVNKIFILSTISLKLPPKGLIDNSPPLV